MKCKSHSRVGSRWSSWFFQPESIYDSMIKSSLVEELQTRPECPSLLSHFLHVFLLGQRSLQDRHKWISLDETFIPLMYSDVLLSSVLVWRWPVGPDLLLQREHSHHCNRCCATRGVQPDRVISKCYLACNSYIRTCKAISKKTCLISETMLVCLKAIACA